MKFTAQFPCRCSRKACQQRVTLPMHPANYIRPRKCKGCGNRTFRVDFFRKRIENRRYACDCSGYGFRHRKGSKWCAHARVEPTAAEIAHRYGHDYGVSANDIPF